jgi:hypothetical protein
MRASIDPAILRRMPKRFPIRLPNYDQRIKILSLVSVLRLRLLHRSHRKTFKT